MYTGSSESLISINSVRTLCIGVPSAGNDIVLGWSAMVMLPVLSLLVSSPLMLVLWRLSLLLLAAGAAVVGCTAVVFLVVACVETVAFAVAILTVAVTLPAV